jgi:hypothetical protein
MLSFSYKKEKLAVEEVRAFCRRHGVGQGFGGEIQKGNYFAYWTLSDDADNRYND